MSNHRFSQPFLFFPNSLSAKRMELEQKYQGMQKEQLKKDRVSRLPQLLASIRALPDKSMLAVEAFAQRLSNRDIRVLALSYPYKDETENTLQKIVHILITKYHRDTGRRAWKVYQTEIHDLHLIRLLRHTFINEESDFLEMDALTREQMSQSFRSDTPLPLLHSFLADSDEKAAHTLSRWRVTPDSLLEKTLLFSMLVKGLAANWILDRESEETICSYLNRLSLEEYHQCIKTYLEARNNKTFHRAIMEQAVRRLGDLEKNKEGWSFLSKQTVEEVRIYLTRLQLESFFAHEEDNERFHFWEEYLDKMKEHSILKKPSILIMSFGQFVVVEFANKGNAAYFYHKDGYEHEIAPRIHSRAYRSTTSMHRRSDMLKDQRLIVNELPLLITRLSHPSGWQYRFKRHMQNYLRGQFTFIR